MSMNGWKVIRDGTQEKVLCTSTSGLIDEPAMTYSGMTVNRVSAPRISTRAQRSQRGSRIAQPPPVHHEVGDGDEQQEAEQQHRHRRALAEVPRDERGVVDVDR